MSQRITFSQRFIDQEEAQRFSDMLNEFLARIFTAKVVVSPVKYLANDGIEMKAEISFPVFDDYLSQHIEKTVKERVEKEMKRCTITITPTLEDTR